MVLLMLLRKSAANKYCTDTFHCTPLIVKELLLPWLGCLRFPTWLVVPLALVEAELVTNNQ
jgi:hypothetical protein